MPNRRLPRVIFLAIVSAAHYAWAEAPPSVKEAKLGQTRNVHVCDNLFFAGQPAKDDIRTIKENGIKRVVTLREDGEVDWDEQAVIEEAGLEFVEVPFRSPDSLTDEVFERVRKLLQDSKKTPTLLHCGSANRVGAVWLTYRVLDQGMPLEKAVEEAKTIGLRAPAYETKALDYIRRHSKGQPGADKSVRPGINDRFLQSDLDIAEWLGRFEIESRDVFAARNEVIAACQVQTGSRVADIGAGTGLYTRLFSDAVGSDGSVFAVDISPRFLEHINERAQADRLTNVTAVLCSSRSVNLPPNSIDVAFICDTYHHFEYPPSTLASIHRALREGGTLVVVDFERVPGKSREFILNHVRAGKNVFRGEIEAAGFEFVEEVAIKGFQENYFLRFRKK